MTSKSDRKELSKLKTIFSLRLLTIRLPLRINSLQRTMYPASRTKRHHKALSE